MPGFLSSFFPHVKPEGKVVLVSGTDQGLGALTTRELSQRGFRVLAACLTDEGIRAWQEYAHPHITPFKLNVTVEADIEACAALVDREAPQGLFCLVNNAGLIDGFTVEMATPKQIRNNMEVNYFGPVSLIKALLPALRRAKGRVVNVSSIAGRFSLIGLGPYAASKFALEAVSDALRIELGMWGIKVVLVEPGFTQTAFVTTLIQKFQRDWEQSPPEMRQLYGEEYATNFVRVIRLLSKLLPTSAEGVTKTIADAATLARPSERYPHGLDTWFLLAVTYLVPTFLRDCVIRWLLALFRVHPQEQAIPTRS